MQESSAYGVRKTLQTDANTEKAHSPLRLWKQRATGTMDLSFLVVVMVLLVFGLVMVFSASYAYASNNRDSSFHFIIRQGIFASVGVGLMFVVSKINYRIYYRLSKPIFIFGLFLLVIVLAFPHDGARRWIDLGFTTFQPSEYAKLSLVILFAAMINKRGKKMGTFRHGMLPFLGVLALLVGLLLLEPHLSGTLLILAIGVIMMFIGGTKIRHFMLVLVVAVAAAAIVLYVIYLIKPDLLNKWIEGMYQFDRIINWLDPFSNEDITGDVWQTCQSLIAIGSGGITGLGLGQSRQKYIYLPEPQNDFIYAIVCEELGLIGAMLVIILFVLLVWRGFVIASKAPDKFGGMLAVGILVQIGLQATLNIAVVTNAVPNTGISLPFFSYGGTALIMQLIEMGIVLNVSRQAIMPK